MKRCPPSSKTDWPMFEPWNTWLTDGTRGEMDGWANVPCGRLRLNSPFTFHHAKNPQIQVVANFLR